ncbi:MAG: sulfur carrier protein ThiS [Actinomycetota bacterium]
MNILVNGEPREIPDGVTVAAALNAIGVQEARGVAVAVDAQVVPRGRWEEQVLSDGQRMEVLRAVQGG